MKRTLLLLCLPLVTLFFSCSTDVDLYAEYKEMPIIYGLLDATADTNFVKITRAFYVQGDAYQSALNPDSSNYAGKLDARLIEYCNGDSVREIILDTITLHGKQQGTFYSPDQKMYYTTEPLNMNQSGKEYAYELKVVLPHRTLVATTDMVGNSAFGPQSLAVNFSKQYTYFGAPPRQFLFRPAKAATFYDVSMSFLEGMSKNKDITDEELEEIFYNKQLDNLTPEEFAVVKDIQSNIADTYSEYFVGEPTLYIENERICVEFA